MRGTFIVLLIGSIASSTVFGLGTLGDDFKQELEQLQEKKSAILKNPYAIVTRRFLDRQNYENYLKDLIDKDENYGNDFTECRGLSEKLISDFKRRVWMLHASDLPAVEPEIIEAIFGKFAEELEKFDKSAPQTTVIEELDKKFTILENEIREALKDLTSTDLSIMHRMYHWVCNVISFSQVKPFLGHVIALLRLDKDFHCTANTEIGDCTGRIKSERANRLLHTKTHKMTLDDLDFLRSRGQTDLLLIKPHRATISIEKLRAARVEPDKREQTRMLILAVVGRENIAERRDVSAALSAVEYFMSKSKIGRSSLINTVMRQLEEE